MKTRKHKAIGLRLGGAVALIGYLALLFFAHVHVMVEAHHGESVHVDHHELDSDHDHDGDHEHAPHPATDHSLAASTSALGKVEQLLAHDLVMVAELVLAPVEEAGLGFASIEDRPKHPPPRLPEQPRSPPIT